MYGNIKAHLQKSIHYRKQIPQEKQMWNLSDFQVRHLFSITLQNLELNKLTKCIYRNNENLKKDKRDLLQPIFFGEFDCLILPIVYKFLSRFCCS